MEHSLRTLTPHYKRQPELVLQLLPVLERFSGLLHPERSEFVHNDGRVELLLSLIGVLPVAVRGTTYNCPLAFWLPLEFPEKPPIVLVQSTPTLRVRVGPTVDSEGRVSGGYIDGWERKAEGTTLLALVEYLIQAFGKDKTSYPLVPISSKSSSAPSRPPPPPASASSSQPPPPPTPQQQQPPTPQSAGGGPPRTPMPTEKFESMRLSGEYARPPPPPGVERWAASAGHHARTDSASSIQSAGPPPPPQPPRQPFSPGSPPPTNRPYPHPTPINGGGPPSSQASYSPQNSAQPPPQSRSAYPPPTPTGYGPPPPGAYVQSPMHTGNSSAYGGPPPPHSAHPSTTTTGYDKRLDPRSQNSLPPHLGHAPPSPVTLRSPHPLTQHQPPQPPPPRSAYSESVVSHQTSEHDYRSPQQQQQQQHGRQPSYDQSVASSSYYNPPPQPPAAAQSPVYAPGARPPPQPMRPQPPPPSTIYSPTERSMSPMSMPPFDPRSADSYQSQRSGGYDDPPPRAFQPRGGPPSTIAESVVADSAASYYRPMSAPQPPPSVAASNYSAQSGASAFRPQTSASAAAARFVAKKPTLNFLDDDDQEEEDDPSIAPLPTSAHPGSNSAYPPPPPSSNGTSHRPYPPPPTGTGIPSSLPPPSASVSTGGGGGGAAPPRPPHPELLALRTRLHSKLSSLTGQLSAQTDAQRAQLEILESDLLKGEPAILDEMQRLQAVRSVCETVRGRYEQVVREAERRLGEYEQKGEGPEVDEIVCSSTVVYNQLLDLVAEDAALEDTIYHLGRGLNSDSADIDLERFLKRVRGLAREQFLKRALINKIQTALAIRAAQRG